MEVYKEVGQRTVKGGSKGEMMIEEMMEKLVKVEEKRCTGTANR